MLRTSTRVRVNKDAAAALDRGVRRYLLDGAQKGFNVSQEEVPHGATSFLATQSAQEPTVRRDGSVWWGYLADYAADVEEGQDPHRIPDSEMPALIRWAKRILGDARAAYPVRRKIELDGTDPQPYVAPGIKAMRDWFNARDGTVYIEEELGR